MMVYNKLVRDRIPEIIEKNGEMPCIRILGEEEYLYHLEAKLNEEVAEFHRDQSLEELADILEVVYALADASGGRESLMEVYQKKHEARGGFADRVYLISKE